METEKLIEIIKENKIINRVFLDYHGIPPYNIELEHKEYTNPNSDYLGVKTYYKNIFDNKYFYIEYMYSSEIEFINCGLAEPVEQMTVVWKHI
jgi:hypothetical protein